MSRPAPVDRVDEPLEPADGAERVLLRFLPDGTEVRVPSGTPIFDAASWNGVAIDSTCGGHGTCRKCKVQVLRGEVPVSALDPRAFSPQELREGWRLACRAPAREDVVVSVPPLQTRPKAALVGVGRHVILRPAVQKRYVELDEPSLEDQRSDVQRLLDGIDDLEPRVDLEVARTLGRVLRDARFKVTAVVCDETLVAVEPGDTTGRRFAIAFDLGTTTVVATLLDLETGTPAAVASMLNRQQPYGADVISRVSATMLDPDALGALRARAAETLDQLAREVCEEAGVDPGEVNEMVVCGNVTMTQLALGIDPEPLSMAPFIVTAHELPPGARGRLRRADPPARAGVRLPVTGRLRGRRHRRRPARHGADARPARAAVHRRWHEQRDRARLGRAGRRDRGAGRPGVRGRPDPLRHARRRRRGRGRADRGRRAAPARHRRRRAGRDVRIGTGGLRGRARARRPARPLRALRRRRHRRARAPGPGPAPCEDRRGARVRPALARRGPGQRRVPVAARRARAAVRQGVDRDGLADPPVAAGPRAGRHRPGAPGRQLRRVPLPHERRAHRPRARAGAAADRLGRQRRRRGRKMAALSLRERAEARSILDEVEYVELSGRADFNDMFVDQLAFPG